MITLEDQEKLFTLIASKLNTDIVCYAFGGTAMMYYGYKDDTKDVDLLFEKEVDKQNFIRAIASLGFSETSAIKIYIPEKLRDKSKPVMYMQGEARFDLFSEKIFRTLLSKRMKEDLFAVHQYTGKHTLSVNVVRKEQIVLLKSVTERDKDFEDIVTILRKDKSFDWQYLIDEVIWQYKHGDTWVLYDMEETLKELQKYVFVEQKYVAQLYAVRGKKRETA